MSVSLWTIEAELQELANMREEAEAEGDSRALTVIDTSIAEYLTHEAQKIDSYAGLIRKRLHDADACEARAEELYSRAKAMRADADRLKAMALKTMKAFGVTQLGTAEHTLRVQGNGGPQPVEIIEPVPDAFKKITVTMSYAEWRAIAEGGLRPGVPMSVAESKPSTKIFPDTDLIREYLKTVKVIWARLVDRGEHLRVE
jgi:Siphovirus Gp157